MTEGSQRHPTDLRQAGRLELVRRNLLCSANQINSFAANLFQVICPPFLRRPSAKMEPARATCQVARKSKGRSALCREPATESGGSNVLANRPGGNAIPVNPYRYRPVPFPDLLRRLKGMRLSYPASATEVPADGPVVQNLTHGLSRI